MEKIFIVGTSSMAVLLFRLPLIQALQNKGLSVTVVGPADRGVEKLKKALQPFDGDFHPVFVNNTSWNLWHNIVFFWELYTLFRKQKPQRVFLHTSKAVIFGSIAAFFARVPRVDSVITGLGYLFIEETVKIKIIRRIVKGLYQLAFLKNNVIFFENPDDQAELNPIGQKEKCVRVFGAGVDTQEYACHPVPSSLSFLFLGRLLKHKGLNEYMEASATLKKKYPHVSFKIVGGFHDNPASIQPDFFYDFVEKHHLDYLGVVEKSDQVLQEASVVVLPSYREGTPKSLLEALATGRPLITTDAPGCRETTKNGVNGFLVPIKHIKALTEKMEYFIQNPEKISEMGKKSREMAESIYPVEKVIHTFCAHMGLLA